MNGCTRSRARHEPRRRPHSVPRPARGKPTTQPDQPQWIAICEAHTATSASTLPPPDRSPRKTITSVSPQASIP